MQGVLGVGHVGTGSNSSLGARNPANGTSLAAACPSVRGQSSQAAHRPGCSSSAQGRALGGALSSAVLAGTPHPEQHMRNRLQDLLLRCPRRNLTEQDLGFEAHEVQGGVGLPRSPPPPPPAASGHHCRHA